IRCGAGKEARCGLACPSGAGQRGYLVPLEILHVALVLLGRGARLEGTEIAALAGLRIDLAGIKPVLARLQFADHGCGPVCVPHLSMAHARGLFRGGGHDPAPAAVTGLVAQAAAALAGGTETMVFRICEAIW